MCVRQVEPPKLEKYFLFGVLCGIALYNHHIIKLPFPLVLFKKLVNVKPSYEDMKEFEPVVARYVMVLQKLIAWHLISCG